MRCWRRRWLEMLQAWHWRQRLCGGGKDSYVLVQDEKNLTFPEIPTSNTEISFFLLSSFGVMKFLTMRIFIPSPLRSSIHRASFCNSAMHREGRVSMVHGASRVIGLEFVRQLLEKDEKGHVVATCPNPDGSIGLRELKRRYMERLNILRLDVTDESTIEVSAKAIKERYGTLNLLINTAEVHSIPTVLRPETTLTEVQKSSLLYAYCHLGREMKHRT
ncbi:hypothetical protein MRB53_024632 [Persea americana]|uniref:Uncharacterized protein n=1 Tax=Persea americana TaxID=3435 RepID=A0ACC2LCY3_PERAE|nr:hypothetical protein MRB53_024632 [Persea americana]